ncbi:hypothetical protein ASNO1_16730 [Corallococcus caeni]|uniref:Uncharacterized protein n=1 Tax=Corallococcus caeni TaxID=3082388 RepID=A0ABQ6QN33_9BACT|nr:hypothetical protein ASNO1_16730 [Corallococcus sp. NO1]
MQYFGPAPAPADEEEDVALEQLLSQLLLDEGAQSIEPPAHVYRGRVREDAAPRA